MDSRNPPRIGVGDYLCCQAPAEQNPGVLRSSELLQEFCAAMRQVFSLDDLSTYSNLRQKPFPGYNFLKLISFL